MRLTCESKVWMGISFSKHLDSLRFPKRIFITPMPIKSIWRLSTFSILLILLCPGLAIVCRKERVSPLGLSDIRGGMNVDCGQFVQHCLKIVMWDGTVVRDCDPLALCPKDSSKLVSRAEYFCCLGNVCNGHFLARIKGSNLLLALLPLVVLIIISFNAFHAWS